MGDAPAQRANGFHLLGLTEGLVVAQSVRDVSNQPEVANECPVGHHDLGPDRLSPEDLAILSFVRNDVWQSCLLGRQVVPLSALA